MPMTTMVIIMMLVLYKLFSNNSVVLILAVEVINQHVFTGQIRTRDEGQCGSVITDKPA